MSNCAKRFSDEELVEMRKTLEKLQEEFYQHAKDEHAIMRENAILISQNTQAIKMLTSQNVKIQEALEKLANRTSTAFKITDNLVATGQTLNWVQKAFLWCVKWGAIVTGLTVALNFVQGKSL